MTEFTKILSPQFIAEALQNPLQNETCEQMHAGSCNMKAFSQFLMGCKGLYKIYLLVHMIPLITLKRKKLIDNPLEEIKKTVVAFIKSLLFAGGYSMLVRRLICFWTQVYSYHFRIGLASGIPAGITLVFQPLGRQTQIAMHALSKSMQVGYHMLIRRNHRIRLGMGECWVTGVAVAILGFVYMNDPWIFRQDIGSDLMGKILYQLIFGCLLLILPIILLQQIGDLVIKIINQ